MSEPQKPKKDAELTAITRILKILEEFPAPAQNRIVAYIEDRMDSRNLSVALSATDSLPEPEYSN